MMDVSRHDLHAYLFTEHVRMRVNESKILQISPSMYLDALGLAVAESDSPAKDEETVR